MPYSVLKISKIHEGKVEVAGEFPDEEKAREFVEKELQTPRTAEENDYMVEAPPSKDGVPHRNPKGGLRSLRLL